MRSDYIKVLAWLLVAVVLFAYRSLYSFDERLSTSLVFTTIDTLCLFLSSVAINRWIISELLYKKRTWLFVLVLIILFVAYANTVRFLQWQWFRFTGSLPAAAQEVFHTFTYQVFNTWLVIFLGSLSTFLSRLISDQRIAQQRYEELQREKAETELNFLKAQINPHFLFNSINSIYGNIDKNNTIARDILLKFSEMLRYQLYECNGNHISMEKEIRYLMNYVELQKLRKEENMKVQLQIDDVAKTIEIAPLLLIPFVENAFKYVSNYEDKNNWINISLSLNNGEVIFKIANSKDHHAEPELTSSKGIGIQNVQRRLELLYPEQYQLTISDDTDVFDVELKLSIQ